MINIEELIGKKYNNLTIEKEAEPFYERRGTRKKRRRRVQAVCDCGNIVINQPKEITSGRTKSCGKCREKPGTIFGDYRIVKDLQTEGDTRYEVECINCGDKKLRKITIIKNSTKCQCTRKKEIKPLELPMIKHNFEVLEEIKSERRGKGGIHRTVKVRCLNCGNKYSKVFNNIKKGTKCPKCAFEKTPEEKELQKIKSNLRAKRNNMLDRCYNPKNIGYHSYGGRGIKVYQKWKESSKEWIQWALNNGFKKGLEIDRIDNDGDYTPENCRWTTKLENSRKTRQVKLNEEIVREIRYGKYKNMSTAEIARIIGCSWGAVYSVRKGKTWKGI